MRPCSREVIHNINACLVDLKIGIGITYIDHAYHTSEIRDHLNVQMYVRCFEGSWTFDMGNGSALRTQTHVGIAVQSILRARLKEFQWRVWLGTDSGNWHQEGRLLRAQTAYIGFVYLELQCSIKIRCYYKAGQRVVDKRRCG